MPGIRRNQSSRSGPRCCRRLAAAPALRQAPAAGPPGPGVGSGRDKPAARFALDGRDHRRIRRQRRIEGDGGPSTLAGGIRDGVIDVNRTSQVDGAEQQQEEHRREHGKLDHRLAAVTAQQALAHQYSALKTALELIVSVFPIRLPMIGVMKLNRKLAVTLIGYCDVGVRLVKSVTRWL